VTNKIYVANGNSNTVTVISGDDNVPPAPTPQTYTLTTTVSEGDLARGGIVSFGVSSRAGASIIDHINAGSGLQTLTVFGVQTTR